MVVPNPASSGTDTPFRPIAMEQRLLGRPAPQSYLDSPIANMSTEALKLGHSAVATNDTVDDLAVCSTNL